MRNDPLLQTMALEFLPKLPKSLPLAVPFLSEAVIKQRLGSDSFRSTILSYWESGDEEKECLSKEISRIILNSEGDHREIIFSCLSGMPSQFLETVYKVLQDSHSGEEFGRRFETHIRNK